MKYISTRNNISPVSTLEAIKMGMVPQGGLFVPEKIPTISLGELYSWVNLTYPQLAYNIFKLFLKDDFFDQEINYLVEQTYHKDNFDIAEIIPLVKLDDQLFIMELFHGPTGAFKDIALQALPRILSLVRKKLSIHNQILILVATSGDTGKAALEGFKNVEGIQVVVYYPLQKVSKIQELQMLTTEGDNTHVLALEGSFDDCQNAVKQIFSDYNFYDYLKQEGFELSSANSINWGRLFPQIVYYYYAYLHLLRNKEIRQNEKLNFVVPTGNFGNILAAWYAKEMGLPIEKLICASNTNKVLADFFNSGVYDINRPLVATISPSMDILISSNLERLLFEISGHQGEFVVKLMKNLREKKMFILDESLKNKMGETIFAGFANETDTLSTIKSVYHDYHYLVDPHTAVGINVFTDYQRLCTPKTKTVITATATPFKFNRAVLTALTGQDLTYSKEELVLLQKLSEYSNFRIPAILKDLDKKPIKKQLICRKDKVQQCLLKILQIE